MREASYIAEQIAAFRDYHRNLTVEKRPLSQVRVMDLFNHQRWLNTEGQAGRQFVLMAHPGGVGIKKLINHDLDGVDLSRAVLKRVSFALSSLRHSRFTAAKLEEVTFFGCDIEDADFSDAELDDVSFDCSNYGLARFERVNTERVFWNGFESPPNVLDSPKL